ncbi:MULTISPECIES: LytR/AlgR family response regulator transcription factor [unclassified Candidatus Frackibacter]|uniref:LytR/AlgR family response regulator transcription factor n=1 Tax=unclassified Candidatus Frackibacter TaxID=2648818 RepID=UPI00088DC2EB|nr:MULTISPECIES: LytTR family DNA-binding domain-containing protein [unclassified Candidatus Frackibacter]SDC52219.1 two component transcriptional regulator, LytTR family [Candidatus Frackibacter sp. WG11]SEM41415.1 two component transcriptional regulator, LytTR family [Candidatus Frackibacter sp. WG12]SFL76104.1 two component transcriptional regulator, LytTR family [Candidatus Frackibacter sp. WG13]
MSLAAVIADDEAPARDELKFLLSKFDLIEIVAEVSDGGKVLDICKSNEPDLLFLDIQMPGKTGIEVAEEILKWEVQPLIIFITAYDEYAIKAFELNAIDYLLKPFTEERFNKTIERVLMKKDKQKKQGINDKLGQILASVEDKKNSVLKIPVHSKQGRIKLLNQDEVIAAYTKNKDIYIKTYDNEYKTDATLSDLEERLPMPKFFRVHRSYLVNLERVKEILPWFKGKYRLIMNDKLELEVPVSRMKVKELKRIMKL